MVIALGVIVFLFSWFFGQFSASRLAYHRSWDVRKPLHGDPARLDQIDDSVWPQMIEERGEMCR
jgi:hypothetical protein